MGKHQQLSLGTSGSFEGKFVRVTKPCRDVRRPTSCCAIVLFASRTKYCCEKVVKPDKGCGCLVKSQSLFVNVNPCDIGLVVAAKRAMFCPWSWTWWTCELRTMQTVGRPGTARLGHRRDFCERWGRVYRKREAALVVRLVRPQADGTWSTSIQTTEKPALPKAHGQFVSC